MDFFEIDVTNRSKIIDCFNDVYSPPKILFHIEHAVTENVGGFEPLDFSGDSYFP